MFFGNAVVDAICDFCQKVGGTTSRQGKTLVMHSFPQHPLHNRPSDLLSENELDICLEECRNCPHSTRGEIKQSDMDREPGPLSWMIATAGNFLRKHGLMGLSCKKCGCSMKIKGFTVRLKLFRDGCLDISPTDGLSRWQRALKNRSVK